MIPVAITFECSGPRGPEPINIRADVITAWGWAAEKGAAFVCWTNGSQGITTYTSEKLEPVEAKIRAGWAALVGPVAKPRKKPAPKKKRK